MNDNQQEEGTVQPRSKPLMVGAAKLPVTGHGATALVSPAPSRRLPEEPSVVLYEDPNQPEPFHRDASVPQLDGDMREMKLHGTPKPTRDENLIVPSAPSRTISTSSEGSISPPSSPGKKLLYDRMNTRHLKKQTQLQDKLHHTEAELYEEKSQHSMTKTQLQEKESQLLKERESHEKTRTKLNRTEAKLQERGDQYKELLDEANTILEEERSKYNDLLKVSDEEKAQLEDKIGSLKARIAMLEGIITPIEPRGIASPLFLSVIIANVFQSHIGTLRCWGCLERPKGDKRCRSHAYGECILKAAAVWVLLQNDSDMKERDKIKKEQLFWVHGGKCSAKDCILPVYRECLCIPCDRSTSDWEDFISAQFGNPRIKLAMYGSTDDITTPVLLMQVFRGSMMSINLTHMYSCDGCKAYFEAVLLTMYDLAELHHFVCMTFREKPKHEDVDVKRELYESTLRQTKAECSKRNVKVLYTADYKIEHQIEYPLIVIVPGIGPVIYAQIPPYYIVIPTYPARETIGELTDGHMDQIIQGVNLELVNIRHKEFFDGTTGASDWKTNLLRKHCRPMLVFPYPNKCCIHLS